MKLYKAQRLFVAIGHVDGKIRRIADSFLDPYGRERPHPHSVWDAKRIRLKELRALRKQLIREALRAYELEIGDAFSAGGALARACGNSDDSPMVIKEDDQTIIF